MFSHEELAALFEPATLTESMFVALEHMQVWFATARGTGLTKVRKHAIPAAQGTFFCTGLLKKVTSHRCCFVGFCND